MKKAIPILIALVLILIGCQKNQIVEDDSWGSRHSNIDASKVSEIVIHKPEGQVVISSEQDIIVFMNSIQGGKYDIGQLDIRPADYLAELILKGGGIKKLSLWIEDDGDIFIDQDEQGHYKFQNDTDRNQIGGIINRDRLFEAYAGAFRGKNVVSSAP